MQRLQAFIHISTCYVNAHRPPGSHIEEALYPLVRRSTGGTLQHAELAAKLAQMAPAKAEKAVSHENLVMHSSTCLCFASAFAMGRSASHEPGCML